MATILLIEDDSAVRDVTAQILRHASHVVDEASDGRAGLTRYGAAKHDLIITDIVMPDMDGIELITKLRNTTPRPRIIAISGGSRFSQLVYLPTAKQLGAQRTLAKPIHPEALLRAVAEVLAGPVPVTTSLPAT